eukprot:Skav225924  [mRNA]  locus=scaffold1500:281581:287499:- [translate_table: standard]
MFIAEQHSKLLTILGDLLAQLVARRPVSVDEALCRIAVLGEAAVDEAHNSFIGKGSGYVQPDSSAKTPLAAIEERAAKENITVVKPDSHSPDEAKFLSGTVDVIIVVLGLDATEGADRPNLELGPGSEKLVRAAASEAPTIVLLQIPGAGHLVVSRGLDDSLVRIGAVVRRLPTRRAHSMNSDAQTAEGPVPPVELAMDIFQAPGVVENP